MKQTKNIENDRRSQDMRTMREGKKTKRRKKWKDVLESVEEEKK